MSDPLKLYEKLKFNSAVHFQSEPSKFLSTSFVKKAKVPISLRLSNQFIIELQNVHTEHPDLSLLDILTSQLSFVCFTDSSRLAERIHLLVSQVSQQYKRTNKTKGPSGRKKFLKRVHTVAVYDTELEDPRFLKRELETVKRDLVLLQLKYASVYQELVDAKKTIEKQEVTIDKLQKENAQLFEYLQTKVGTGCLPVNRGKEFHKVGTQQQRRKLVSLKEHASKALWFADTFGLLPTKLTFKTKLGNKVSVPLNDDSPGRSTGFKDLSQEDKLKIQQLSFILDKFSVSDVFYHELKMLNNDVPETKLIIQARNDMSSIFEINRVPGGFSGAYISFKKEMCRLFKVPSVNEIPNDTKIAFGGDGTQVSKSSTFVNFSFRVLGHTDEHMGSHKTLAIVKCPEKFTQLSIVCGPLFREINDCVNNFQIFLTGDKKFQNTVLGLPVGFSSAQYACNHCKIPKTSLMTTDLEWDHYHKGDMVRTLNNINVGQYGFQHLPIIKIPFSRIVQCTLHLLLRITDVLEGNVIEECKQQDHACRVQKKEANNLAKLEKLINESVHFEIKEKTEKGSTSLTWTSLTGDSKRKLLKELPAKLHTVLHPETVDEVVKIWQDFDHLISMIQNPDHSDPEYHLKYFKAAHAWIKLFLSLRTQRLGYDRVTWYMHDLVWHIPYLMYLYHDIEQFSGQTLEKNNDLVKTIHMKKSRKWDPCVEALRIKKRLERGEEMDLQRRRRAYNKQNMQWWQHGIHKRRKELRSIIEAEIASTRNTADGEYCENIELLPPEEIKERLKSQFNVTSRLRSKKKLLELYYKHIADRYSAY